MDRTLLHTAMAFVVALTSVPRAHANPTLILRDPSQPLATGAIQISDNGPGDASPIPGLISFSGPLGPNWIGTATVASSKPVSGTISFPEMTVVSVDFSSTQPATLWIGFSDDFFGPLPPDGSFVAKINGNAVWGLSYVTYADPANGLPSLSTFSPLVPISGAPGQSDQLTYFANGGIAGSFNGSITTPPGVWGAFSYPYSLTMAFSFNTHGFELVEQTSFSASLERNMPVPDTVSTIRLLGLSIGLMGIATGTKMRAKAPTFRASDSWC